MDIHEARDLALATLARHDLSDWSVAFDRATKRFGLCRHRTKTISLSAPLVKLNDIDAVTDTIRHEVAHALAGHAAGHGPQWRAMCAVTGARPERCISAANVVMPPANYYLACPTEGCETRVPRQRKTASRYGCRRHGTELVWERGGARRI